MDKQICEIERVENGFIVRYKDGDEIVNVYEDKWEKDTDVNEPKLKSMQMVFENIMNFFGFYNSEHDKFALDVSIINRSDFPAVDTIADLKRDRDLLMKSSSDALKDESLSEYEEQKEIKKDVGMLITDLKLVKV